MNRLLAQLPALQAALSLPRTGASVLAVSSSDVDALIRAIKRKVMFAETHMALLAGIEWERVDGIGRRTSGGVEPDRLSVRLSEASLLIEHPGAVIDHVYLAFDGLTAALVNMTDTLGRLLNLAYGLGIDPRRASLVAVRDRCTATSSLGVILNDPQYTKWLERVRDLRGRCQHADVEDILTSGTGPYSRRGQPYIDQAYSWSDPAQQTPIVSYAQDAVRAAEHCIVSAVTAILSSPQSPIKER